MNLKTIENTTLLNLPYQTITQSYHYHEDKRISVTMDQCIAKWYNILLFKRLITFI